MTLITQTHHAQNPVNVALLNYVQQRGQVAWSELFEAFGDGSDSRVHSIKRFNTKLAYLLSKAHLKRIGIGNDRIFSLGDMAGQKPPARELTTAKKGQVDGSDLEHPYPHLQYLCGLVPPRQHVSTDTYKVPRNTVLRPGALDYKSHASHGDRC